MEKYPVPQMGTEGNVIAERFGAFVIDSVIISIGLGILLSIGFALGDAIGLFFVSVGGIGALAYKFVFEGVYGYTPGKSVVGLVVVKSDGSDCTMGASVIRNILLFVDQLPFFYIIGIVLILFTDRNQRVGDLVGDTVVVEQQ